MRSRTPFVPFGDAPTRTFGMLTSFPPTACGIATFSAALSAALVANGGTVDVVRCGNPPEMEDAMVVASLGDATTNDLAPAVDMLNNADAAIIQHEYGIYQGADGESVIEVMDGIEVPSIVVAHTVVSDPTLNQRRVLEQVCDRADAVVVMTASARSRLIDGFDVDASKVRIIPHGAATPVTSPLVAAERLENHTPRLLTWGLLGPGKGIEWAIDAVASLTDLQPRPTYVIAGATHPKVAARSGESYRRMLIERVEASDASGYVSFDDTYRDLTALTALICAADVVVLPYDSADQVTSGVLVDAVAAGRPVISTAYPHAVELLGSGAGLVVPQRDSVALAAAIRAVLTDPELADSMAAEARRLAPDLAWTAIAGQYEQLTSQLVDLRDPVNV